MLILLAGCAWLTDAMGVHAVFGAFILGAVTPRGVLTRSLRNAWEPLTTTLFLPVFFVYSGLNTSIRLLASPHLLGIAAVLLALAVAGKGLACTAAARASGESWRDAMTVGTLMNARGLMELILLNIGLEQGIITPTLFTMLVLMALLTTFAASPIVERLMKKPASATDRAAAKA
jgi:Kef-type K+ transport system membrane component KefB